MILLLLFTLVESLCVGTIVGVRTCIYNASTETCEPSTAGRWAVLQAFCVTSGLFLMLSAYTIQSKRDFSKMGSILGTGIVVLLFWGAACALSTLLTAHRYHHHYISCGVYVLLSVLVGVAPRWHPVTLVVSSGLFCFAGTSYLTRSCFSEGCLLTTTSSEPSACIWVRCIPERALALMRRRCCQPISLPIECAHLPSTSLTTTDLFGGGRRQ